MKLKELKARVYELSGVATTPQLKAKYPEIKLLDMRLTTSWEKALSIVQPLDKIKDWINNPPEEYKELFSEIEKASRDYDNKRTNIKQLNKDVISMLDNLEALVEEIENETERLSQDIEITKQVAKQAELN